MERGIGLFTVGFILVLGLNIIISSCQKEDPNVAPGKATLTIPLNSATDVALNSTLSWQEAIDPDGDAVVYDVYFGTDATPVTVASSGQKSTTYTPALIANNTYYWKVVAKDPKDGTSESSVWNFSTLNNGPGIVALTTPVDEAANVGLDAILSWQAATDPDGDAVVYDVYFGTNPSPETIISADQEGTSYTPTLVPGTTYYWKVVAKDPLGGVSESAVWSFKAIIQIGDFYEGGVVFYIDETGKHGLVCPISDQSPTLPQTHGGWGCNGVEISGADGTAIGTGLQNSLDIVAGCVEPGIAADICLTLTLNGYSDWYLPSIDELKAMHQSRAIIEAYALANGGTEFYGHYYYSSSESTNWAWALAYGFGQAGVFQVGKVNYNYPFRAVRAF